ncbi:DUF2778 domain-containing protein [Rhizobium sp. LjRoot30]|uniref:DUF2778 domain-containing protein n=1 Tax=Rhizobium sp. LjRoot30 TaxID=3342320 RepID=UPI003ECD91D8
MASSVKQFGRSEASSVAIRRRARGRRFLGGVVTACAGIAAVSWMMATLATMQTMATSYAPGAGNRLEASLALNPIIRATPAERRVQPSKFSRMQLPLSERIAQSGLTEDAIRSSREKMAVLARLDVSGKEQTQDGKLTADAIRLSHTRMTAVASIKSVKQVVDTTPVVAVAALTGSRAEKEFAASATAVVQPILATALVEPTAVQEDLLPKPFNLVLADPAATMTDLPDSIPLPVSRPEIQAEVEIEKPEKDKEDGKRTGKRELAYASPDASMDDDDDDVIPVIPRRKGKVAYYDISAGVVYMPNGEKLEAHSGIGAMRDNPKFTHVKMRGPTPAGTYRLSMRESLFYGVAAIRLTPTNGIAPLGRTGLLAHSYLLKRRGDSHGCVAFANYPKFLKAFQRGEIDTMVIVPKMSGWRSFTASADDGKAGQKRRALR